MKKILITILCVLGIAWGVANTQAATMNLDFNSTNADFLVGTVTPGVPNNVAAQSLSLSQLLSMTGNTSATATITGISTPTTAFTFNRSDLSSGNFPAPNGLTATLTNTTSGPLLPVDSNQFVIANFGSSESAFWFVGNLTTADQIQVPTTMDGNNISSITTLATPIGNIAVNPVGPTTGIVTGATNVTPSGTSTASTTGTPEATTGTTTASTASTGGTATGGNVISAANQNIAGGNAAKVPEPGTILLLGLGFLSLAGIRRKFQKC